MTDRVLGPSGGSRRRRTLGVLSLAGLLALSVTLWFAIGAGAVVEQSGFEDDDGNLTFPEDPESEFGTLDWNSFATVDWLEPEDFPYRESDALPTSGDAEGWTFKGIEDDQISGTDTVFAGGTKQDDECATVKSGPKPPNKDDLKRIYLSTKIVDGDTFLNLAWVRIPQNTTSASAHVAFEFNQGDIPCGAPSDDLVEREDGDMLVVYDFEGGTDTPSIKLARWTTDPADACDVASNSPPCWGVAPDLTDSGFAEAAVNVGETVDDDLTPPEPPDTESVTEPLDDSEFGEAGINLSDAGVFDSETCVNFGTAFGVSRSSGNSGQAQMKDLVGPADFSLTNCGEIKIIKHTNPRGVDQDFDFTSTIAGSELTCSQDENTDGDSAASFTLNDAGNDPGEDSAANTQDCLNVPANAPGEFYTVTEGADPSGFAFESLECTASGGASVDPTSSTTDKSAEITMVGGGLVTCTYTNTQQLGAIEILKTGKDKSQVTEEDPGPNFPLAGAKFSIKDPDGNALSGSPFTTDDNGRICVDGLGFGDYKVQETEAPDGYDADDTAERTVTVGDNAECDDDPYGGASESFTNTPLTDLSVHVESQSDGANGTGATESRIECIAQSDSQPIGDSPQPDSGTHANPVTVTAEDLAPGRYSCRVEIDP